MAGLNKNAYKAIMDGFTDGWNSNRQGNGLKSAFNDYGA
jgi:hypothetical protein